MNISRVTELTGLSAHTLRYYEQLGFIRHIARRGGKRVFTESDITWLEFITRLKATGMPLSGIKTYSELRYQGDSTISARKEILLKHHEVITDTIRELQQNLQALRDKITIYEEMEKKNHGTL